MMSTTHGTLTFTQLFEARLSVAGGAFSGSTRRAMWGVPAGEALVFDESSFRVLLWDTFLWLRLGLT